MEESTRNSDLQRGGEGRTYQALILLPLIFHWCCSARSEPKRKAEDPIGEVHTDEPPGTQSGVGKGQRGNQEGAQGMLRKGR